MQVFKEYPLDEKQLANQTVYLPANSDIVSVVKSTKGVVLVAVTKHAAYNAPPPELRTFKICASDEIFYVDTVKYIGSFESSLGLRHVIEV